MIIYCDCTNIKDNKYNITRIVKAVFCRKLEVCQIASWNHSIRRICCNKQSLMIVASTCISLDLRTSHRRVSNREGKIDFHSKEDTRSLHCLTKNQEFA